MVALEAKNESVSKKELRDQRKIKKNSNRKIPKHRKMVGRFSFGVGEKLNSNRVALKGSTKKLFVRYPSINIFFLTRTLFLGSMWSKRKREIYKLNKISKH